ncbi:MAG: hypothetical protein JJU29_15020 [Verrucomicrobia bacterium]|nr:hypothetical protein [Verrucomicrobiota bacterium]MCH8513168.1 hypothetical protein [Kiritimatiellia bacterium]
MTPEDTPTPRPQFGAASTKDPRPPVDPVPGPRKPNMPPEPPPRTPPKGVPMENLAFGTLVETMLKHPENLYEEMKGKRIAPASLRLLILGLGCYLLYGILLGSFSGGMQWWASPLKAAGGIIFSSLICLPSLYIFGCLARSNCTLRQCLALQAGLLALSGVLLIGFLPVAWVFSTSIESIGFMGSLHLVFWGASLYFGVKLLLGGMESFQADSDAPVRLWICIFVLVCLQMTTTLRPLLGPGETLFSEGKQFFLLHWGKNM